MAGTLYAARRAGFAAARGPASTVTYKTYRGSSDKETKYFDTSFSGVIATAADWTGTEVPCTNYTAADGTTLGAYTDSALIPTAIGPGYGQIIGSKYRMKKIRVRGQIRAQVASDQADVTTAGNVRVVLVQDLRPNGAQAQGETVFPDMGTSIQAHFAFQAMGTGEIGKFRILKDETFVLNPAVAGTDGASTVSTSRNGCEFSFTYKPKVPIEVLVKSGAATPTTASLSNCNIFLLAHFTDTTGVPTIGGCARCYYED